MADPSKLTPCLPVHESPACPHASPFTVSCYPAHPQPPAVLRQLHQPHTFPTQLHTLPPSSRLPASQRTPSQLTHLPSPSHATLRIATDGISHNISHTHYHSPCVVPLSTGHHLPAHTPSPSRAALATGTSSSGQTVTARPSLSHRRTLH